MRKVNREGFVSFDGAKYGVPWQYSGKEVRVRILSGSFEVYDGEVRIACHKAAYISGKITWLPGQYHLSFTLLYLCAPNVREISILTTPAKKPSGGIPLNSVAFWHAWRDSNPRPTGS
jgi:hypothetical protein